MNGKECPACGTWDTERVHMEWYQDMIEETRICENCPTQYTNSYSLFEQSEDDVPT